MKKYLLCLLMLLPLMAWADDSGTCGDSVTWSYVEATHTLTISGNGLMSNYKAEDYKHAPWYNYRKEIQTVLINNNVTCIGRYAFYNCTSMTSVTIPNSVTSIDDYAFYNCSNLASVIIPNNVTSIGRSAFEYCGSLESVVIGSSVTSIGDRSFTNAPVKTKIFWLTNTRPDGYDNIPGVMNYASNDKLGSGFIVYPFLSSMFNVDGIIYVPVSPSERTCDAIGCLYDSTSVNTRIPSSIIYRGIEMKVRKIQPYICYNNKFIKKLVWDNDSAVSAHAFHGCSNMETVKLGQNITSIGISAFSGCTSLQSVSIPEALTTIDSYAFSGCSKISLFSIPKSVKKIGNFAFQGCKGLKNFIISNRDDELTLGSNYNSPLFSDCPLDSVYIGGNITYNAGFDYGYSPFYRNTSLRTVVITDKETEISNNEFYGCTNLQNISIGDGVKTFGTRSFSGCSSLHELSFGSQLETIGEEAFSDCASVTKIFSKAFTPPTCGAQALDDINKWNCKLYVPIGSLNSYQAAGQWKDFFFIEEDGSKTPDTHKCATPTIQYSNGKLTFSSETEGAVCLSTITDKDITTYNSNEVQLGVTYNISVYATKNGYENSDAASATLCWVDVEPKTDGISNGIAQVKAQAVLIQSCNGVLNVSGLDNGTMVHAYNIAGQMLGYAKANGNNVLLSTNLKSGEIAILKIGDKSIKIVMK